MKMRAPSLILYRHLARRWLVSAPTPFFPQSGMGEITVCVPVLAPLLFALLLISCWRQFSFLPLYLAKVTYAAAGRDGLLISCWLGFLWTLDSSHLFLQKSRTNFGVPEFGFQDSDSGFFECTLLSTFF